MLKVPYLPAYLYLYHLSDILDPENVEIVEKIGTGTKLYHLNITQKKFLLTFVRFAID